MNISKSLLLFLLVSACGQNQSSDNKGVFSEGRQLGPFNVNLGPLNNDRQYLAAFVNRDGTACWYYNRIRKEHWTNERDVFFGTSYLPQSSPVNPNFTRLIDLQNEFEKDRKLALLARGGMTVGGMVFFGPSLFSIPGVVSLARNVGNGSSEKKFVAAFTTGPETYVQSVNGVNRIQHPLQVAANDNQGSQVRNSLLNDIRGSIKDLKSAGGICPLPTQLRSFLGPF